MSRERPVSRDEYNELAERLRQVEPGGRDEDLPKFVKRRIPLHLLQIKNRKEAVGKIFRPIPFFKQWPKTIIDQNKDLKEKVKVANRKFVCTRAPETQKQILRLLKHQTWMSIRVKELCKDWTNIDVDEEVEHMDYQEYREFLRDEGFRIDADEVEALIDAQIAITTQFLGAVVREQFEESLEGLSLKRIKTHLR